MYSARGSAAIDLSIEEAWGKLKDLALAPEYVPGVKSCEFITDSKEGLGTVRRVYPMNMDEKVISWNEGRGIKLELSKKGKRSFFPFKSAFFDYRLTDYEPCILVLTLEYDPYLGALGQLLFGRIISERIKKTAASMGKFYNNGK
ncbi:MAG: SRPBCC family protein [Clostridia bacterium]|nr:SRPBCC family protein [Clostridia bacterium]MBN2882760.1 SRPBCC family protein [Clostridia bacterium]